MKAIESRRQLIPRLQNSDNIVKLNFTLPTIDVPTPQHAKNIGEFRVEEARIAWEKEKSIPNAIELLVKAKFAGIIEEFDQPMKLLQANYNRLSDSVKKVLLHEKMEGVKSPDEIAPLMLQQKISVLRSRKLRLPEDPLTWNDLAFYHAALGNSIESLKCMSVAFKLSRYNSFIARGYSRLLVHLDDPERAVKILSMTGQTKSNPMILSADISIKTIFNLKDIYITAGIKLLESFKGDRWMTSELSASVGSLELESGSIKKAKQHLKNASQLPTENTISQLFWLKHKMQLNFSHNFPEPEPSIEAKVIHYYSSGDYKNCVSALLNLHSFQPFSERPVVDAVYLTLVALKDPATAVNIFENYAYVLHNSAMAVNNQIVALLELGRMSEAEAYLFKIVKMSRSERENTILQATIAMHQYRIGNPDLGRTLYQQVVDQLVAKNDKRDIGLLYYYFGKEELRSNKEMGASLIEKAKSTLASTKANPEVLKLLTLNNVIS